MSFIRSMEHLAPRNLLHGLATSAALLSIFSIAVIMIFEVVSRYFLKSPLGWNVYLIERYLMIGMVFLGLSYTHRTKSHVAVDVIFNNMTGVGKKIANIISIAVILAVLLLVIWGGVASSYDSWLLGESPPPGGSSLPWPTWTWKALIPLGASVMALDVIGECFGNKKS
tara:strand:+ start:1626 stop:2132 length:507 start_codon:yes stop_codon:yes gene_type:complete